MNTFALSWIHSIRRVHHRSSHEYLCVVTVREEGKGETVVTAPESSTAPERSLTRDVGLSRAPRRPRRTPIARAHRGAGKPRGPRLAPSPLWT
jgi:hypothetical protein